MLNGSDLSLVYVIKVTCKCTQMQVIFEVFEGSSVEKLRCANIIQFQI